jgi:Flp pilus assembly protein TadG
MGIASALRSLLRNTEGVAVVELALAAPILALMVVGVADLSNAYSRKLALEQAAQRSIEKIMQTTASTTPDETVKNEAVAQAGGGLVADDVTVTYELYCDLVKQADYDTDCTATQSEARYLNVTVTDEYQPMFPMHFAAINANGTYTVTAQAGMRIQ